MTGEFVRVVNRSKDALTVTWDGRQKVLAPGEHVVPYDLIGHAKRQHRIMGTEDPFDPNTFESLIACPQTERDGACPNCHDLLGHDCSPAKQSKAVEAINAKWLPKGVKREVVQIGAGFSRAQVATALPDDAAFAADRA